MLRGIVHMVSIMLIIHIISCKAVIETTYHFPSDTAKKTAYTKDFIELVDGRKIEGEITSVDLLRPKKRSLKIVGTITLNNTQYEIDNITAYQDKGAYHLKISKERILERIIHGKINMFIERLRVIKYDQHYKKEDEWIHTRHHIQKDNGKIVLFSIEVLKKYINESEKALALLEKYDENKTKKDSDKYLEQAIDIYNSENK